MKKTNLFLIITYLFSFQLFSTQIDEIFEKILQLSHESKNWLNQTISTLKNIETPWYYHIGIEKLSEELFQAENKIQDIKLISFDNEDNLNEQIKWLGTIYYLFIKISSTEKELNINIKNMLRFLDYKSELKTVLTYKKPTNILEKNEILSELEDLIQEKMSTYEKQTHETENCLANIANYLNTITHLHLISRDGLTIHKMEVKFVQLNNEFFIEIFQTYHISQNPIAKIVFSCSRKPEGLLLWVSSLENYSYQSGKQKWIGAGQGLLNLVKTLAYEFGTNVGLYADSGVKASNGNLLKFYAKQGFMPIDNNPKRLFYTPNTPPPTNIELIQKILEKEKNPPFRQGDIHTIWFDKNGEIPPIAIEHILEWAKNLSASNEVNYTIYFWTEENKLNEVTKIALINAGIAIKDFNSIQDQTIKQIIYRLLNFAYNNNIKWSLAIASDILRMYLLKEANNNNLYLYIDMLDITFYDIVKELVKLSESCRRDFEDFFIAFPTDSDSSVKINNDIIIARMSPDNEDQWNIFVENYLTHIKTNIENYFETAHQLLEQQRKNKIAIKEVFESVIKASSIDSFIKQMDKKTGNEYKIRMKNSNYLLTLRRKSHALSWLKQQEKHMTDKN